MASRGEKEVGQIFRAVGAPPLRPAYASALLLADVRSLKPNALRRGEQLESRRTIGVPVISGIDVLGELPQPPPIL